VNRRSGSRLRHGFQTEAEAIALELRQEIGAMAHDRLDYLGLAGHLGIPVASLDDARLAGFSVEAADCLSDPAQRFDALTVCVGTAHFIVYNPTQAPTRRASTIAHELSHIVLEHPPGPAIGVGGCRQWDPRVEEEATWLSGALLVPRRGAIAWMAQGRTIENGADYFGVSVQLFRWRVNGTGIMRQLSHRRRRSA
jgi:hypothetical protein